MKTENFTVLVVDDNPDNTYLARYMLEREGFKVAEVNNGLDAINFVESNDTSLVLMDIQMPGMDGLEATRKIKQFSSPPIIVAFTARLMEEDINEIEDAGCDGIIEKPMNPGLFHQQIKDYLQKK